MAEKSYTIAESYELPSKGLVYGKPVNAAFKIKSMTTEDEMKRLTVSDAPYKVLCDIIEDCLVEKPGISVYDMCLGDYQFLLHKMRIVTYGSDYKMSIRCPSCGETFETTCDLNELQPISPDGDFDKLSRITLPRTGKLIDLRFQTPRVLDEIAKRKKDIIKKHPEMLSDPGFLLTLMSVIDKVDGHVLNEAQLENFVRKMPLMDANYLMKKASQYNERVGLNTNFSCKCSHCGFEMETTFRITPEFFGPSID